MYDDRDDLCDLGDRDDHGDHGDLGDDCDVIILIIIPINSNEGGEEVGKESDTEGVGCSEGAVLPFQSLQIQIQIQILKD